MEYLKRFLGKILRVCFKILNLLIGVPLGVIKNLMSLILKIITFPYRVLLFIWRYTVFIFAIFFSSSQKSSKAGTRFLLVVLIATASLGTWAGTSEFDRVITAQAKVVSSDNLQTIQHFEGGIVKSIHVKTGELVKKGDPLVSLEPLEAEATYEAKK